MGMDGEMPAFTGLVVAELGKEAGAGKSVARRGRL